MPLSGGTRVGPYEILAPIGAGGMGEVYKARDTRLARIVAIKVLPADQVTDLERKRRFVQEAKAASALNHPSIVTVHDIGSDGGTDYLVMEWVDGRTLAELIAANQLKLADVLKYAAQAADALAKAHSAGIIHRDLKPGNIMVSGDGLVKVLDFGLAKLTAPMVTTDDVTCTMAATEDGTILGTIAYMSPEQAEGKMLDARSDIFSFGAVLYEMIARRRAFQGDSKIATLWAILHMDPAPSNAPPEIERIVARCLRKDPGRRFQSMADLRVALIEAREESATGTAPVRRMPAGLWIVAVLVGSALVITSLAMLLREPKTSGPPPRETPLTTLPGKNSPPRFHLTQVKWPSNGQKKWTTGQAST
jgi:serine/threonine protein kinase